MHQGIDRGRNEEEQGELFGAHNIFKFDPNGFVPGRVRASTMTRTYLAD